MNTLALRPPPYAKLVATSSQSPRRRWFNYTLLSLLGAVAARAFPCGWLVIKMQQVKRERQAVAAIEEFNVQVEWSEPSGPRWLRGLLGDDLFRHVDSRTSVHRRHREGVKHIKGLDQLTRLFLACSPVTDADLENLQGLTQLRELHLDHTSITDAGRRTPQGVEAFEALLLISQRWATLG